MATVKRNIPLALSAFVVMLVLMAVPSRADDVTFFDTSDTITASATGSRITILACGFTTTVAGIASLEGCTAMVSAPSGSIFTGASIGSLPFGIMEADGSVSDAFTGSFGTTSVIITFLSDPSEVGIPLPCSAVGGCPITEDGTVQVGETITWSDATGAVTTDNISFQSDAVEGIVPEPASLTLLGSGLLAIAGYVRRRLA